MHINDIYLYEWDENRETHKMLYIQMKEWIM